ncbi:ethanolamine ammonia-lyase small subunit [Bacillus ectoiniformans]|uniref:ethanolamine ammonia-lyase subunit EutC n=1 Tax=Bacillus ectoiniformans TaxID=1494429 RepID=UPI001957E218|nr:ethanolamine ammonia-lyase subunit EutC [Bacillus ectoiniformans]MBM7649287.1 ethanolamine ammonia-lyase small subunit [Bacillus ectoiniformans]
MKEELIASITKLVIERLSEEKSQSAPTVDLWHKKPKDRPLIESVETQDSSRVTFKPLAVKKGKASADQRIAPAPRKQKLETLSDQGDEEKLSELRKKTPSRIAVGRAGSRPKTDTWLQFRFDHAAAVDAVYGEVPSDVLDRLGVFSVQTRVKDKEEYIRRPDLGRKLSDEAKEKIKQSCKSSPTVQIVISNGLSAKAIETNIEDVYLSLQQSLNNLGIETGTTFYVDKGRVALMDEIGDVLEPEVVIMLIGERPGLVSAESLSAYLCYKPRKGVIEADRMVVSNIHKGGIPPVEAGAYLGTLIQKILSYQASGVSLVKKET